MKTLFNAIFTYRVNIIYTYFHCISPVYSNECGALLKRCTETNILLIGLFFFFPVYLVLKDTIICVCTKKNVTITKKITCHFRVGFQDFVFICTSFLGETSLRFTNSTVFSVKRKLSSH